MKAREISIDALRGIAIVGMILSGTISHNPDLPGWLFHAQVGPTDFKFHPENPGITWVDLVFPFFLFAMGLAFPFSLNRMVEKGESNFNIIKKVFFRSMKLFMFAVLLGNLTPYRWQGDHSVWAWILALFTFGAFFLTFSKFPKTKLSEIKLNLSGYISLLILVLVKVFAFNQKFSIHTNDIIILVLANMALFGAIIWLYTRSNWWPRLAILVIYLAFRLTSGIEGSLNQQIFGFTLIKGIGNSMPGLANWLSYLGVEHTKTVFYNSNFIKYLFIVLPGSIIGDIIYNSHKKGYSFGLINKDNRTVARGLLLFLLFIISYSQIALYSRWGISVHVSLLVLAVALQIFIHRFKSKFSEGVVQITLWSTFWFALGVLIEPYEGGIRKDHATLSYFFLTSGLAGYMLLFFKGLFELKTPITKWELMPSIGKNPMVGYVVVTYFIMPILYFTQLKGWMQNWHNTNPWLGLLQGIILTALMILITHVTVKKKYFWKT